MLDRTAVTADAAAGHRNAGAVRSKVVFANSLRGVAALLVVFAHYTGVFWYARPEVSVLTGLPALSPSIETPAISYWTTIAVLPVNFGPLGVAIFFLISGFVIPFAFETQTRPQFLLGRLFRIWPTYFVGFLIGVAAVVAGAAIFHTPVPFSASSALLHSIVGLRQPLGIQPIDGIVWTLEVEIVFYAVAALIAPFLRTGSLLSYLAPLGLVVLSHLHVSSILMKPAPYVIFMFIGTALNFRFRATQSRTVTLISIAALLLAAWSVCAPDQVAELIPSYALAFAVFAAAMALRNVIPEPKWLAFLARISYPLYVIHSLTGFVLITLLLEAGVTANIALAIAFLVAIGSARALNVLIETPSHQLGRSLGKFFAARRESLKPAPAQDAL
jgi:peptidoglycan/LPS O-acetylase OafA/YrhL